MKNTPFIAIASALFCAGLNIASAQITGVLGSTSAPASTLGGYTMTTFGSDPSGLFSNVTSVNSPLGGSLTFDTSLSHRRIGSGWATWSNGYTGDVYYDTDTALTITLPTDTLAFYFYGEPQSFSSYNISAWSGTTLLSTTVGGQGGATYFGFYSDGSVALTSISISTADPSGFAVGEFGIATGVISAVPEPSTYAMFGAAALVGIVALRRRRSTK